MALLALPAALVLPLTTAAQTASNSFTLQKSTEAPGTTLHAGTYSLAVLDRLEDRTVMRLDSPDGKTHLLLLGVHSNNSGAPGQPLLWDAKETGQGKHALRGFVFNTGDSVEFVYPKADAVALAKANHSSVVAVDPASEGRPELGRLSSGDMQMVNLWLLTPIRVGQTDGLEAKHYVPQPVRTASISPFTNVQASSGANAPASLSGPAANTATVRPALRTAAQTTGKASTNATTQTNVARAETRPHRFARLPQTASSLPAWTLLSACSLVSAAGLRMRRRGA